MKTKKINMEKELHFCLYYQDLLPKFQYGLGLSPTQVEIGYIKQVVYMLLDIIDIMNEELQK